MKITPRDKNLLMFFPSIVILMIYGWTTFAQMSREIKELDLTLKRESKKPLGQMDMITTVNQVELLKEKVAQLQKDSNKIKKELAELQQSKQQSSPIETITHLTEMFRQHKILLISESEKPRTGQKPEILRVYETYLKENKIDTASTIRALTLTGGFYEMQQFFLQLELQKLPLFPISLTMKKLQNTLIWEFIFWI